jgi:hypothetical protein
MGKLIPFFLGIVVITSAIAQTPKHATTKLPSATPLAAELPLEARSSSLITPDNYTAYINSIAKKFLIKEQSHDPFGNNQDLTTPPVVKAKTTETAAITNRVTLADVVMRLDIGMIIPSEKKIVIKTRSFRTGDEIPVKLNGQKISLKFTAMTAQQLTFSNVATGETATRELNQKPAGMTPGNRQNSPLGMTPNNTNAPFDLGSDGSAPQNFSH